MTRTPAVVALLVILSLATPAAAATATAQTVTLTVSVVDQSGNRIGNAELTATWDGGSSTATTASNGKAFLDVQQGAEVEISVSHPDYIRNHPLVVQDASEQDVTVPVYRRGKLTVSVTDPEGRVADARVIVRKEGRIATGGRTGDGGSYTTGPIEQGEYHVTVVKQGYLRNQTTITVGADTSTSLRIKRGSVTLRVAVRDPHFDPPKPVPEATISIDSVGEITTLPDGTATVGVPVNTDLSLEVTKDGYEVVTQQVTVEESDLRANVSLRRTPSISLTPVNERVVTGEKVVVKVTDEYGDPVANATVELDGEAVGQTDQSGQLAVPVSEPGEHTLMASRGNLDSEGVTVQAIEAGSDQTATTATPTDSDTETTPAPVRVPGFTPVTAVLALLLVALGALVRRS